MKPRPQSGTGPAVPGATTSEMAPESSLDNGVMLLVEKMTSLQGQIEELEKQCGKANTYAAELKVVYLFTCNGATWLVTTVSDPRSRWRSARQPHPKGCPFKLRRTQEKYKQKIPPYLRRKQHVVFVVA